MSVLALTSDNFDDAVGRTLCWWSSSLGLLPTSSPLDGLAEAHAEVAFGRVTPEAGARIGAMFGLPPGPGLVIFRERIVLYCEPGVHSGERIESLLAQVRSLDMDAVRAAIEEEKQAAVALRMRRVCPTARRGQLPEAELGRCHEGQAWRTIRELPGLLSVLPVGAQQPDLPAAALRRHVARTRLPGVAFASGRWWLILVGLLIGYVFAWAGHFFFEKNRPATFRYPLYSFLGDWVMWRDILVGRIKF